MPRDPACRSCQFKKVGCKPIPGRDECERCLNHNIRCERPAPDPAAAGATRRGKRSCEQCRGSRTKCERAGNERHARCISCTARGIHCSFTNPDATATTAPAPGAQRNLVIDTNNVASDNSDLGSASTGARPGSPGRPFWETVLAPSPDVE